MIHTQWNHSVIEMSETPTHNTVYMNLRNNYPKRQKPATEDHVFHDAVRRKAMGRETESPKLANGGWGLGTWERD